MNPNTRKLHALGQRLWLDKITRELLQSGRLEHYISELSVTGLTSNPTIFEHAIGSGVDSFRAEFEIEEFKGEGLDVEVLAARLQREGVEAFTASWRVLLSRIKEKSSLHEMARST